MSLSQDLKQQVFKYAHDNILRQLRKTKTEKYREIETLYLLLGLKKLGRQYQIEEDKLASYLRIEKKEKNVFERADRLNHFSVTVCLLYIRNQKKYSGLKCYLEEEALRILSDKKAYKA